MGLFSTVFGGGGKASKIASAAQRSSQYLPYDIFGPFGSVTNTGAFIPTAGQAKQGMKARQGTFKANLSPEMQAVREMLMGAFGTEMGQLGQSAGGFLGITPEMFAEFERSNQNDISPEFLDASRGYLAEEQGMGPYDFDAFYADRLANMRALDAPLEERGRLGNIENQFGRGVLASTAGGYQTEGLERALASKDLMRHEGAFGQAMGRGDQYNQIRQMLQQAAAGFGQAGTGMVQDRFKRAMDLFGAGQQAETLGAQRASGFLGDVGGIDQFLANLMTMSGNLGAQRSGAQLASFGPMFNAAMASDQRSADWIKMMQQHAHEGALKAMEVMGSMGGGMAMSDKRLKKNVERIGTHPILNIGIYKGDYIWNEPFVGVMADELEKIMPEAVFTVNGYKAVNYSMIGM